MIDEPCNCQQAIELTEALREVCKPRANPYEEIIEQSRAITEAKAVLWRWDCATEEYGAQAKHNPRDCLDAGCQREPCR